MNRIRMTYWIAMLLAMSAQSVTAQNEGALKAALEGTRLVMKIDMPGTQKGIDVYPEASQSIDYGQYGARLKSYGTAIRAGEAAMVTLVKVKKDLIEIQLNGGGFGTWTDDTGGRYVPYAFKTRRERDLEQLIKRETNPTRKSHLQAELDELQDRRDRENRRLEVERSAASDAADARVAEKRVQGGSRINLRFARAVPYDITAARILDALSRVAEVAPAEPSKR